MSPIDKPRKRVGNPEQKQPRSTRKWIYLGLIIAVVVIAAVAIVFILSQSPNKPNTNGSTEGSPYAVLDTSLGTITVKLYSEETPITVGNFINLSKSGFYNGTLFHRISPGFMIQGGDPNSKDSDPSNDGQGGPGYTIPDEIRSNLKNVRGMMVMANSGTANSAGSQFFILVADASWLDGSFTIFGNVTQGMDVVDAIANTPNDGRYNPSPGGGRPLTDVVVIGIRIIYQ
ncbi:MAG TPA: peptidylprolyl isomerase [Candidatus Thermoplasmatota archaeon]|nr:peptidylprolyl isomerase [Candidatus Thermoplasmatota archaeon]